MSDRLLRAGRYCGDFGRLRQPINSASPQNFDNPNVVAVPPYRHITRPCDDRHEGFERVLDNVCNIFIELRNTISRATDTAPVADIQG